MERQSEVDGTNIVGEESGRLPPRTPIDWTPTPVKTQLSEPEFDTVDNHGQCSEFTFQPVFAKGGGILKIHALPTGVIQIQQDSSGTIRVNGWEFYYNDWDDEFGEHRTPMDDDEKFPPERKGYLDKYVLMKLDLTKHRMVVQDALFF